MLGHKLWQCFSGRFETRATLRGSSRLEPTEPIRGITADDVVELGRALELAGPAVVVNCIGIVKQIDAAKDPLPSIETNALFPHRLARLCEDAGARLIHVSTDCVFSGRTGDYSESDVPDPPDLYGRSKLLGEVDAPHALTIRTSIIGRELDSSHGLLEWFLAQRGGRARGFARAIFSGFTTLELADVIARVIEEQPELHGIWHVAADPIDKYRLLSLVKDAYGLDIELERDEEFTIDRSLDGSRFRTATGIEAPKWEAMIERMAADPTPYDELRRAVADR